MAHGENRVFNDMAQQSGLTVGRLFPNVTPDEARRINLEALQQAAQVIPNYRPPEPVKATRTPTPLEAIAAQIKALSFRDLVTLAETIRAAQVQASSMEVAILTAADILGVRA